MTTSIPPDQLQSTFQRYADHWKTNDGAAVAGDFVEAGSLINPFGQRADGRAAIAAMYAEYFRGMLRGTSTTFQIASVRSVEGDHAFVDVEQTVIGPDGQVVLAAHLAALLRRESGGWRIVDGRPYAFAPLPPR